MIKSQDQLNRMVFLNEPAKKIVSLVPSQTELLYDLGLGTEVTGITKFCVHPEHWKWSKNIIGGTKNINIEKIKSLKPDLIIANKEENEQEQILELANEFPVWISDVRNLKDATLMIEELGRICGKHEMAHSIIHSINENFASLQQHKSAKKQSVLYLIWKNPYISIGNDTFIHDMLTKCGLSNCLANEIRYPEITAQQMSDLKPDLLFLSSEPYPFSHEHIKEFTSLLPESDIHIVDGEMFSWYGSRLLKAPVYFKTILKEINSHS